MNSVMTIVQDSSSETLCLNNTPSAELSRSALAHYREYVHKVLNVPNSPPLQQNPDIMGRLVDMILIFWNIFYQEGNCGGTEVIEHLVYTPKGHPPIRLKNRPIKPGLINSLKEQIAAWLKDGVICSGGISS